ncbi:multidrug ABC transporter ATPase [Kosmotoga arenicorallina S304]|uniref:Multidrug ABC transporter ATPase n=2 Tax=Kosmotoga arenicorallina TaxID=688066 RepID=A0A176K006_9BACT|nr:multidrug ABC transporter ATPase [Kosmotoga arenicorallina S304]
MIKSFIRRYWWMYLMGASFVILVDLLQLVSPRIIGNIIDRLKTGVEDISVLKTSLYAIIGVSLGIFISRFFWRIFIMGSARRFEYYSKKVLFEKLLSLPASFYDRIKVGELMARFTNDVAAVRRAMGPAIVMSVDAIFMTLVTVFAMGSLISWKLTWIVIIPLPPLALISAFFGRLIHTRFKKVQAAFAVMTDSAEESVSGIRVIKSYGQEKSRYEMMYAKSDDYVQKNISLIRVWGMFFPLIQLLASIGYVIAMSFGGRAVITGQLTLGEFVTFTTYLGMLIWPMMATGWLINIIQRGRASYSRLKELLNEETDIITKDPAKVEKLTGDIEINRLTFKYPNSKDAVLKDVYLHIPAGSKIAIVGTTGSGKSTLAKILTRLYPIPEGKVFIDGKDINRIDPAVLRENIAYVPQETFLFSETVKNNIAFGVENASDEEIIRYASIAAIHSDIENDFPEGYETMVGERGVTLSGGQKQRIAIARALLKKAPIVILDDCLSAVDTETELKIISSLREGIDLRTVIVISHRLKAVRDADIIYVLHDGEIIESGAHDTLMEKGGLYKRMYERQLLEEKLEEE